MKDNKVDKGMFAQVMYGLAEDFGGTVSDNGLLLRFDALKEYSIKQIRIAGTWLLKNRKVTFPAVPTTKEIIDVIEATAGKLDPKAAANLECDKVFKKLKEFGRAALPKFLDKNTAYLMTYRWTFEKLGMMDAEELKWFRKDFMEAYQDMEQSPVSLIGVAEKAGMLPAHDKLKQLGFKGKKI